ncbi:nucleic acid-binding protein [Heliocybe sulcata]|uniref:Nucleic acid-binding protein n=1 Tax=Heliocybe sulcata TaxID=5364 RepID=A0A5C3NFP8_9AGAM|nr:nucleic acid-binding protein [Heliocybe sulcata]
MVAADLSKLTLIGRLGRDPETRKTRNDEEYISYTVATTNYPAPPPNPDGTRREPSTTWHSVYCFQPGAVNYLKTLKKGTRVYVEANFELRDPDPTADPDSPQGQRQIFLKHEAIRVIQSAPKAESGEEEHF